MDENQKNDTPEEEYTGILGDYQETPAPEPESTPVQDSDSGESPKKNNSLKIAGIAVASAAILGCLGFLGVKFWNGRNVQQPETSQTESSGDISVTENNAAALLPENTTAAAYSENYEFSPALLECLYQNYLSQYASAMSYYGIDPATADLKTEKLPEDTGEDMTWYDYIMAQVKSMASQMLVFQESAAAAGFTLSEEDKQSVEEQLATEEISNYGENASEDDVRKIIEMQTLASAYFDYVIDNMEFTDADLEAYYQENKNQFDTCGLMGFSIAYDNPDETADTTAETEHKGMTQEEAKALADKLMQATSPEDFEQQVHDILIQYEDYTEEETEDLKSRISTDTFSYKEGFDVSDWAFGGSAKVGETYLVENEGNYGVYLMLREPSLDTSNTVNVRHILFATDSHMAEDENTAETAAEDETQAETTAEEAEAAKAAALETCRTYAQNALEEWEKGDKTEDSFAELANQYSEDPGSNTNGGLYEKVYPGQMVQTFNDWCFDASRKPGDTGIVETDYGVHVMYFSGTAEPLWKDNARSALQSEGIDSWYEEQTAAYPVAYNEEILNSIG